VTYRFLDHTADVAVELGAPTLGGLYAEALAAFTDTVTERERVAPAVERRFAVEAADAGSLLVDWLGDLLYAFEVEGFLFHDAEVEVAETAAGRRRLAARARGETYDPARHPVKVLVKAVTYHGLAVERLEGGGWRGRVVFDI
jgi:SHS2 domain-containing protein